MLEHWTCPFEAGPSAPLHRRSETVIVPGRGYWSILLNGRQGGTRVGQGAQVQLQGDSPAPCASDSPAPTRLGGARLGTRDRWVRRRWASQAGVPRHDRQDQGGPDGQGQASLGAIIRII